MTLAHPHRRLALVAALSILAAVAAALAGPVLATSVAVNIVGRTFDPASIEIAPGDTVVWTVTEEIGEPHSVTSGKLGEDGAGSAFDSGVSGLQEDGATFSFTFEEPGTYDYYCIVHAAEMTGQVVVAAGAEPVAHGVPFERRLLAGGILVVTLVLCFGAAILWRRMNPA